MNNLTTEERALLSAALRYWQRTVTNNIYMLDQSVPHEEASYFDDGSRDGITPLDTHQIDLLCAKVAQIVRAPAQERYQHHIYGDPKCPCERCKGSNPAYVEPKIVSESLQPGGVSPALHLQTDEAKLDRLLHGMGFEKVHADGTRERVNPAELNIRYDSPPCAGFTRRVDGSHIARLMVQTIRDRDHDITDTGQRAFDARHGFDSVPTYEEHNQGA